MGGAGVAHAVIGGVSSAADADARTAGAEEIGATDCDAAVLAEALAEPGVLSLHPASPSAAQKKNSPMSRMRPEYSRSDVSEPKPH